MLLEAAGEKKKEAVGRRPCAVRMCRWSPNVKGCGAELRRHARMRILFQSSAGSERVSLRKHQETKRTGTVEEEGVHEGHMGGAVNIRARMKIRECMQYRQLIKSKAAMKTRQCAKKSRGWEQEYRRLSPTDMQVARL